MQFRLQTDNFRLHDKQTVNGLRKIAWASVLRSKRQHTNTGTNTHKENGNFRLFAANGAAKRQTSVGLLQTETEVCFPGQAKNNGYGLLLFKEMPIRLIM